MAHVTLDTLSGFRPAIPGLALLRRIALWRERSRLRDLLAGIDDRSLRDAGIDPGLAAYETSRPFWEPVALLRQNGDSRHPR